MNVAVVTGSAGLVGGEAVRHYARRGCHVVGIDNDMRAHFFGKESSTKWQRDKLREEFPNYEHLNEDIRDERMMNAVFSRYGSDISVIVHAAAQPSHDWAARDPTADFTINANGTLAILEAARRHCPGAAVIAMSTNKVYGDAPNRLPLVEQEARWELDPRHPWAAEGIDETMSIDQCTHSIFGASKVAADILAQEYGRYFGLKVGVFRGGCLTGPGHSGAELHGFLSYLMKCAVTGREYVIYGYKGKQVRDNIHSADVIRAFDCFQGNPRAGEVYNIGGGRFSSCSVLEAIGMCEEITGRKMKVKHSGEPRRGDHIWWISSTAKFRSHYPEWRLTYDVPAILGEIHESCASRGSASA